MAEKSVSASRVAAATVADGILTHVGYIYEPIRQYYNPLAEAGVELAREFVTSVENDIFSDQAVMDQLNELGTINAYDTGSAETATEAYAVAKDNDTYTVEVWSRSNTTDAWIKVLYMTIAPSGSSYKGTITIRTGDEGTPEGQLFKVDYDGNC